jgi:type IV secretory pathway VirB2 component (pilin)
VVVNLDERKTQMKLMKKVDCRKVGAHFLLLTFAALTLSSAAVGAQGGQALPWEAPLTKLQQSLSGPVAGAIAVIALVAIGVVLVFGGEWNEFARRSVYAVCAIAFIVSAATLLAGLFQVGAAVV